MCHPAARSPKGVQAGRLVGGCQLGIAVHMPCYMHPAAPWLGHCAVQVGRLRVRASDSSGCISPPINAGALTASSSTIRPEHQLWGACKPWPRSLDVPALRLDDEANKGVEALPQGHGRQCSNICLACGFEHNHSDAKFCQHCGRGLHGANQHKPLAGRHATYGGRHWAAAAYAQQI